MIKMQQSAGWVQIKVYSSRYPKKPLSLAIEVLKKMGIENTDSEVVYYVMKQRMQLENKVKTRSIGVMVEIFTQDICGSIKKARSLQQEEYWVDYDVDVKVPAELFDNE